MEADRERDPAIEREERYKQKGQDHDGESRKKKKSDPS